MFRLVLPSLAILLALAAPAAAAQPCSGDPDRVERLELSVKGQAAYGLYALPAKRPRGLVMLGHGFSFNVDAWRAHLQKVARRDGVIAVAMNYRGLRDLPKDKSGFERSRGYPVKAGGEDIVAAARYFDRECANLPGISILGVSMGANATGLAVASGAKRANGKPLFDYWVGVEGAHNLVELYQGARALGPANEFAGNAKTDIEAEAGGPFETMPGPYLERSNVARVPDIARSGLKGVVFVHAYEDGLAPYNQAREMQSGLRAQGLPVDLFSVGRRGSNEPDTTLPSYAGQQTGNAGHGAEGSQTHIVIQTGFDRLSAILTRGEPAPCNRDFEVNDTPAGVAPDPKAVTAGCRADPLPAAADLPANEKDLAVCSGARPKLRRGVLRGRAGCKVRVAVWRAAGKRCRFVSRKGRVGRVRSCSEPVLLRVRGNGAWRLRLPKGTPAGRYRAAAFAGGRAVSTPARIRVSR